MLTYVFLFCVIKPILPCFSSHLRYSLTYALLPYFLFPIQLEVHHSIHSCISQPNNIYQLYITFYMYSCTVPTILICILSQPNMLYISLTQDFLQTPHSISISPLPFLLSLQTYSIMIIISSFLTFPTSQPHLPIPFCLTSKSSHSCWYHASAPHPYISLFTTILFHPSLPKQHNYLRRDLVAASLTIPITLFASTIISPILLKPAFRHAFTVSPR